MFKRKFFIYYHWYFFFFCRYVSPLMGVTVMRRFKTTSSSPAPVSSRYTMYMRVTAGARIMFDVVMPFAKIGMRVM